MAFCSQCGGNYAGREWGWSHCEDHRSPQTIIDEGQGKSKEPGGKSCGAPGKSARGGHSPGQPFCPRCQQLTTPDVNGGHYCSFCQAPANVGRP